MTLGIIPFTVLMLMVTIPVQQMPQIVAQDEGECYGPIYCNEETCTIFEKDTGFHIQIAPTERYSCY